jgi:hypothetical protein
LLSIFNLLKNHERFSQFGSEFALYTFGNKAETSDFAPSVGERIGLPPYIFSTDHLLPHKLDPLIQKSIGIPVLPS